MTFFVLILPILAFYHVTKIHLETHSSPDLTAKLKSLKIYYCKLISNLQIDVDIHGRIWTLAINQILWNSLVRKEECCHSSKCVTLSPYLLLLPCIQWHSRHLNQSYQTCNAVTSTEFWLENPSIWKNWPWTLAFKTAIRWLIDEDSPIICAKELQFQ